MKKVRVTENELVGLIEKLVKENLGNGNGHNFGLMGAPTAKYKEIFEKEDIEEDNSEEETLDVNITDQPGSDDEDAWMESVNEQSVERKLSDLEHKLMQYQDDEDCCGNLAVLLDRFNGLLIKHGEEVPFHVVVDELAVILNKAGHKVKGGYGVTTESKLISRLKRKLIREQRGKGCAKSEGGDGCIDKDGKGWFIWNNKKGGIFKRCSSKKDCEEILSVPAVHG